MVRGCSVSKRYINVCNCDMFSVVNVYRGHLKLCGVCINGRRYVRDVDKCGAWDERSWWMCLARGGVGGEG